MARNLIYPKVGNILAQAENRRIDILMIGDSNQAFGGFGWDHGMQFALSNKYGLYATGVLTTGENGGSGQALGYYSATGDTDVAAVETGAPEQLDSYMDGNLFPQNYSYLASGTFVQGMGLYMLTVGAANPFDVLNSNFRYHYCYGTFPTGAGSFTPGIRLEVAPYTNLITGSPISTNTGQYGFAYTTLDSGIVGIPRAGQICGRHVHVGTTCTGPWLSYFTRVEIVSRTTGISFTSMYSRGGQSLYDMAAAAIAAHDHTIYLQLYEARRLQESNGDTPIVIIMVNSGVNDRNETSQPSLGPGAYTTADSPEAYVDNLTALVTRIENVWNKYFTTGELYWLIMPSHPISEPDDAELITYRTATQTYVDTRKNMDMIDLTDFINADQATAGSWYDGGGNTHLTQLGYESIGTLIRRNTLRKRRTI